MILTLQLILQFFAHWLGDYTHLSRPYMLQAKRTGSPMLPIFHHALVHAILQFLTVLIFTENVKNLADVFIIQLVSHFLIDVWKGRMNVWFPSLSNPANKYHWYVFGIDQFFHSVIIIITFCITIL